MHPGRDDLSQAELLSILSLASDLGVGLPAEHGLRACYIGLRIADQIGLTRGEQADLCQAQLLKDAGCTSWSSQIAAFIGEVARLIAERLGASETVQRALPAVFEQWNGAGMPLGLRGEAIPIVSRIVYLSSFLEVAHASGGREAALGIARERSGDAFDPTLVQAFDALAADADFWTPLYEGEVWALIEELLPRPAPGGLDELARCCADFVDMKSHWLAGHSRRVADLAQRMGARLGYSGAALHELTLAALVHDLGLVAVPSFVLNKPDDERTGDERSALAGHAETVRMLLGRFPPLSKVSELASLHHAHPNEPDGAAGIIALANQFDELTHAGPGRVALTPEQALSMTQASNTVHAALSDEVGSSSRQQSEKAAWPAGLTAREVEVLRCLASGRSRRAIAVQLVVSESTIRSHLEHIYTKLNVSTRVGAVLFAIENSLIS